MEYRKLGSSRTAAKFGMLVGVVAGAVIAMGFAFGAVGNLLIGLGAETDLAMDASAYESPSPVGISL